MAVKVAEISGLNIEELKLKDFKVHELPATEEMPVSVGRRDAATKHQIELLVCWHATDELD